MISDSDLDDPDSVPLDDDSWEILSHYRDRWGDLKDRDGLPYE